MTVPFRILPAATPPKNILAISSGYKSIKKDNPLSGNDDISYAEAFKKKPVRPEEVKIHTLFVNMIYGLTDDITISAMVPHFEKKLAVRKKKQGK